MLLPSSAVADDVGGLAAGDGVLTAPPTIVGHVAQLTGTMGPAGAGRTVQIQALSAGTWQAVTTTIARGDGTFTAAWRTSQPGQFSVRAVPVTTSIATRATAFPATTATIYRPATATWYDQSGHRAACGVRLRKRTLGVAHKSLPCGSLVDVTFHGRTVSLPVVDRGPYARGVSYDVTIAAARLLGMVRVGRARVGVLPAAERTPVNPLGTAGSGIGGLGVS